MNKRKSSNENKRSVDTVFVLLIFCGFAISVLLVLLLSGSIYQNISDMTREGEGERIALSYIRTRIRNFDQAGAISVGEFNGIPALLFEEELGGNHFTTTIYIYDGWVRELFHETAVPFEPEDGTPLIRADYLGFEEIDDIIKISTGFGSILISPRSMPESEGL